MNHSFIFLSTKNEIDNLQNEFKDQCYDEIEILTKKVNLNFPKDLLVTHTRLSTNSIKVDFSTFLDIKDMCIELLKIVTLQNKNIRVLYRHFHKTDNVVGGLEFHKGKKISGYLFNDRETICDAITDYLCSAHIALDSHEEVHIDGEVISVYAGYFIEKHNDLEYKVSNHRIFLNNDEFIYLHMEYDINSLFKNNNDHYNAYGLSNATWTKNGLKDEDRLDLSETITGNVVENFESMIPYKFANSLKD